MLRNDLDPRVFFNESIELTLDDGTFIHGPAINLSCGGVFVISDVVLKPEETIRFRFALPNEELVTGTARVVRTVDKQILHEHSGIALCFISFDGHSETTLRHFVETQLKPKQGAPIKLKLSDLHLPITAHAQSLWGDIVSVDAELPFLRLGAFARIQTKGDDTPNSDASGTAAQGVIRWVAIHVDPESGIPKLNIGIEEHAELSAPVLVEEELDPVHWAGA